MSDNLYPIAKLLTPAEAEPWKIVTLDEVRWWRQVTPMETASREDRLRCPNCNRRFEFCSGQVRGTYFRHKPGVGSCRGTGGGGGGESPYPPTRTMWIRYKFARLLRHLLPEATVDEKPALARLDGHMIVTFPDGGHCAVEVDCSPAGFDSLSRRWEEHNRAHRPVIWVFSGDKLITKPMQQAPGTLATTLDPLLIAFMEMGSPNRSSAKPFVDKAYRAFTDDGTSNRSSEEPRSLLLYLPGEGEDDLGAIAGLRGLVPGRKDVWLGTLLRTEIKIGQPSPIRISRRRGLYFHQDLEMVKRLRRQQVLRRRERERQKQLMQQPSVARSLTGPKPNHLMAMVTAPPEQWLKAMLDHFLGEGVPFTIAAACKWVDKYFGLHPSLAATDPAFLREMHIFWEKVAAKGSVKVVNSRPVAVVPLTRGAK